jgi:hypothetical protein
MKKLLLFIFFLSLFAIGSSQNPFAGFLKAKVSKDMLKQQEGLKAIGKPVMLIRPAMSMSGLKITKSDIPGKTFDAESFQSAGIGVSAVFYNGTETNFSINALAMMPVDLSGKTPFNISPALAIEGWNILSAGIGYDPGLKKVFGLLNLTYSFTAVK